MYKKFGKRDLLKYLGVSRDTLRFYEEKGLIKPQINNLNNYREYDILDILNLMIIDFYKKRGMTINEINDVFANSDVNDIRMVLESKQAELKKVIYDAENMLQKLVETQEFCASLENNLSTFTIKPMPLYKINGELSDFISIDEYENIKDVLNADNNDMLTRLVRNITFVNNNITDTKIFIVSTGEKEEGDICLDYKNCLYIVMEEIQSENIQNEFINHMQQITTKYADSHGLKLLGEVFVIIRLITHKENVTKAYNEIYIPFE